MWSTLGLVLLTLAHAPNVSVRTDHAQIEVGTERYRLVGARAPMTAVISPQAAGAEVIVEVIRLGTSREPVAGAVPLKVTFQKEKHLFPNRTVLQRQRVANWAGQSGIASFPVRYPLRLKAGRTNVIRVALRRPDRGGEVGVRIRVNLNPSSTLAELDRSTGGEFQFPAQDRKRIKKSRTSRKARKRRAGRRRGTKRSRVEKIAVDIDKLAKSSRESEAAGEDVNGGTRDHGDDDNTDSDDGDDGNSGDTSDDSNVDGGAPREDGADGGATGDDDTDGEASDGEEQPDGDGDGWIEEPDDDEDTQVSMGNFKVILRNEMGTFFALGERTLIIDGVVVHQQKGALPFPRTIAFQRSVQGGAHDVEVRLSYLGDGGIFFQYVNGYTFHVNDRKRVMVPPDGALTVVISGTEAGGAFAELTDKPSLRWDFEKPDIGSSAR